MHADESPAIFKYQNFHLKPICGKYYSFLTLTRSDGTCEFISVRVIFREDFTAETFQKVLRFHFQFFVRS